MTEMPEVSEEAIQASPEVEVKAVEDKGGVNGVRASSLRTRPSARPKRTVHFLHLSSSTSLHQIFPPGLYVSHYCL